MTKWRLLLLLLLVVSISLFRANILPKRASFRMNNRVEAKKHVTNVTYAALPPYTRRLADTVTYAQWARTGARHDGIAPDALSSMAFAYYPFHTFDQPGSENWEAQTVMNSGLDLLHDADDSLVPGSNRFAAYPFSLVDAMSDGTSIGPLLNPSLCASNSPGGSDVHPFMPANIDPAVEPTITSVPEPSTAALFAGLGALLAILGLLRVAKPPSKLK